MEGNKTDVQGLIQKIMEGAEPREVIDAAINEKSGYHKEKRIRDGKVATVNVKNTKRKRHVTLTPAQKKAIKKAHSAMANKKRAKSIKKGAAKGLYKESVDAIQVDQAMEAAAAEVQANAAEAIAEAAEDEAPAAPAIICPACGGKNVEIFVDPDQEDEVEETVFICPDCGASFVLCSADDEEEEDDDDDKDDDKDDEEAKAEAEAPQDESAKVEDAAAPVAEEAPACDDAPVAEEDAAEECGEPEKCDDAECGEPEDSETGLFFAAED